MPFGRLCLEGHRPCLQIVIGLGDATFARVYKLPQNANHTVDAKIKRPASGRSPRGPLAREEAALVQLGGGDAGLTELGIKS